MIRHLVALAVVIGLARPAPVHAQAVQEATVRRAQQAYDNLDYRQARSLALAALRGRLSGPDRAHAYELLGSTYSAMDSILRAVDAFKNLVLLEPERTLDPSRTSPKTLSAFQVALTQVLVVRGLHVDSATFVGGQGAVPVRYTVTQPAHVVTRVLGQGQSLLIDSSVTNGQVNLRWPARLPNGDPVPAGTYTVLVEAHVGQNSFSASQPIRVDHGSVDTVAHLAGLPGFQYLPETEVPPRSWRPLGLAFLYTAIAGGATLALENSSLGTGSRRELLGISAGALVTGLVMTLRKPASRPAEGNIRYNQLLRLQLAQRNAAIAEENSARRRQIELTVVSLPKTGGGP